MNLQQAGQPRSLANGYGRRRVEKEGVGRPEHKWQYGKTNVSKLTNAGVVAGSKGGYESPSRERLVYSTTCLIGLNVEVQVKDGSLFSGIFHATDAEEDFGIILKMARQIRTISSRVDNTSKAPSKILIIPSKELVQIIAKGVPVTREGLINEMRRVKQQEIMLDSSISQSRHVDVERELERWVPDEDDPQCPELENIFDGPWRNRGWDQFEANEALFGVKSTFDEDLYTTKLERGPQMRELEREALRIAREIEGEETQDLHLAEERGAHCHENFDIDEETKYSSVFRGVDDSGYDEDEDILLDSQNSETFGGASSSVVSKPLANLTEEKSNHGAQVSSCPSSMEEEQSSLSSTARDLHRFGSNDNSREMSSQFRSKGSALESESSFRVQKLQFNELHAGNTCVEEFGENLTLTEVAQTSEFEGERLPSLGGCIITEEAKTSKSQNLPSSLVAKKDGSDIGAVLPNYASNPFTSLGLNKAQEKTSCPSAHTENAAPVKAQGSTQSAKPRGRPGSSTSSTSESGRAPSAPNGPGLSPTSSVGSLSSEKSTLNPHAKEFKLNPNAKSFIPTQTPLRPASPVSDGPFYFPPNVSAVPHMHGMPVGVGVGPSYPHQPVIYNPQAAPMQSAQAYFHPNGPQYGQQMIFGHPRPVLYMQTYSPEMQYKGRDF